MKPSTAQEFMYCSTRMDMPMKPQVPTWQLSDLLQEDAIICGDAGTVTYWEACIKNQLLN